MSKGATMRLSPNQKYRFGKKYGACVTGERDWMSRFGINLKCGDAYPR